MSEYSQSLRALTLLRGLSRLSLAPFLPPITLFTFLALLSYLAPSLPFSTALCLTVFLVATLACHDGEATTRRALLSRWALAGVSWPGIGVLCVLVQVFTWAVPLLAAGMLGKLLLYSADSMTMLHAISIALPLLFAVAAMAALLQALLHHQGMEAALGIVILMPLLVPLFLFAEGAAQDSGALWFLWGQALLWCALSPWLTGLCWRVQLRDG